MTDKFTTAKSAKSWKQASGSGSAGRNEAAELDEDERAEIAARKAAEHAREQQINASIAADLLGGFEIKDSKAVESQASSNIKASGKEVRATSEHPKTDTISQYPLSNDTDFDNFAASVSERLLSTVSKVGLEIKFSHDQCVADMLLTHLDRKELRSNKVNVC